MYLRYVVGVVYKKKRVYRVIRGIQGNKRE